MKKLHKYDAVVWSYAALSAPVGLIASGNIGEGRVSKDRVR